MCLYFSPFNRIVSEEDAEDEEDAMASFDDDNNNASVVALELPARVDSELVGD
jgi:hypothetical protein